MKTLILILSLLPTSVLASTAYRQIQGHWVGLAVNKQTKHPVAFDLLDAPCEWTEPNATPYILDTGKETQVISTHRLPNGTIGISQFRLLIEGKEFDFVATRWSEQEIIGNLIDESGKSHGRFELNKQSTVPLNKQCFFRDPYKIVKSTVISEARSLYWLRASDGDYCCSDGAFSPCKISGRSSCNFAGMIGTFAGKYSGRLCAGVVTTFQKRIIGKFTLRTGSPCQSTRYK